jgi:p-cumate 2,3-dioxygenase beta subunit
LELTRQHIEDFLFAEQDLLDEWKLEEWASLFTSDGMYLIPPMGNPNASHAHSVYFAHDDRARLEQRALRLLKKEAHVEYPHSTTVHNINNVKIVKQENDVYQIKCNFTTYRTKREKVDTYLGVLEYQLVAINNALKIREKKVILKLDSLRPQGKISIIL